LEIANGIHSKVVDKGVYDYTFSINEIMKIYAMFSVVLSFPFLITGFFGMNVQLPMGSWNNCGGFLFIIFLSITYALIIGLWLRKLKHTKTI
jgi:Mg2+ and Co2+ transporter CorA